MGEIAEMMLDGTTCQSCGEFIYDGDDGPGFPQFCEACEPSTDEIEEAYERTGRQKEHSRLAREQRKRHRGE